MALNYRTIILAAISALMFSSCRKEYRCQCSSGWGDSITILKANSNSRAENKCNTLNSPPGTDDGAYGCHLQ